MTDAEWATIRKFTPDEFDARDRMGVKIPGTGKAMDYAFVQKLDRIRARVGFPVYIHSGIRTKERNEQVGGADSSSHLDGHAADVEAIGSRNRFLIRKAALAEGICRIGTGKTFLHLDDDPTKDQDVEWLYAENVTRIDA